MYGKDLKGNVIGALPAIPLKHLIELYQKYMLGIDVYLVDKADPRQDTIHVEDTPNQIIVAFMWTPKRSN